MAGFGTGAFPMMLCEILLRLLARPRGLKPSRASLHLFLEEKTWEKALVGALSFEHFSGGAFQLYLHETTPLTEATRQRLAALVPEGKRIESSSRNILAVSEKTMAVLWNGNALCLDRPAGILKAIDTAQVSTTFATADASAQVCIFQHDKAATVFSHAVEAAAHVTTPENLRKLLLRLLPRVAAKSITQSTLLVKSRAGLRKSALSLIKEIYFQIPALVPFRKLAIEPSDISVHLLIGVRSYREVAVTLRSWERFTKRAWNCFLHDDGTLEPEHLRYLEKYCGNCRIIPRSESNIAVNEGLAAYPECRKLREKLPHSLKFFDFLHYAPGKRYFVLDADVLFFAEPGELLQRMDAREPGCWFNKESPESYCLTRRALEDFLGRDLWRGVNSGVAVIEKKAMSLDLIEKFLAHFEQRWDCSGLAEQTAFALCASAYNQGAFLPKEYEISFKQWKSPGAVMRHYAAHTKFDMMYVEGVVTLLPRLLKS